MNAPKLFTLKTYEELEQEYLQRNKRTLRVPFLVIVGAVLIGCVLATKAVLDISRYENLQDAQAGETSIAPVPCHEPTGATP